MPTMSTASRVSPLSGLVLSRGKYDPPQRERPFQIIKCAIPFSLDSHYSYGRQVCFPILQMRKLRLRKRMKCAEGHGKH